MESLYPQDRQYKMRWTFIGKWDSESREYLSRALEWWISLHEYEGWIFEGVDYNILMHDIQSKLYITQTTFPDNETMPHWIRQSLSGVDHHKKKREEYNSQINSKLLKTMKDNRLMLVCEYETDIRDEEKFTGYEKICFISSDGKEFKYELY